MFATERQPDSTAQDPLRMILQGTAAETGERFFMALVENLARALGTHGAWVTEYLPERRSLRPLAFLMGDQWMKDYELPIDKTPCQGVIEGRRLVHHPDCVLDLYPDEQMLKQVGAVSYMGVPLMDLDGTVLGHLAVLDRKPLPARAENITMFEIFAGRAAAELRRLRVERQVREREAQLAGLVGSAMDAIVQLDERLRVAGMNPAAERTFGLTAGAAGGEPLVRLLQPADAERLERVAAELIAEGARDNCRWITGGLNGRTEGGGTFPAEATLSVFELHGRHRFTLILRNVNERLEAERRISSLSDEA